ncbi:MAG: ABC transporter ATP-binding protein [Chloroflexota bacterium]|nr:MAG: ABC transporter ATP-binding protein [Chloroflexota bacterium]
MLAVRNLRVRYGQVEAVKGVDFEVNSGEIVVIVGSNGAGKSTILKTISGLLKPTEGTITLDGKPIHGLEPSAVVKLGISQVAEGRRIFPQQSVVDNMLLGAYTRQRRRAEISNDLEHMFERFPILRVKQNHVAGTLSGGEQQMLAISQALMSHPRLILFDEPSLGLAPLLVEEMFRVIRDLHAQGATILLVEQMVTKALELCHRGYVLETGRIVLSGPGKELLADPRLQEVYLGRDASVPVNGGSGKVDA